MGLDANDMFESRMQDVIGLVATCVCAIESIETTHGMMPSLEDVRKTLKSFVIEELDSICCTFEVKGKG